MDLKCSKCMITKNHDEFYKQSNKRGFDYSCKECRKSYNRLKHNFCKTCNKKCSSTAVYCRNCSNNNLSELNRIKNPVVSKLDKLNMYFLGLMWADGYIANQSNYKSVGIDLVEEDFIEIQKTIPSYFNIYKRKRKNWKPIKSAKIGQKHIVNFYISHDYENKNKPLDIVMNSHLLNYWLRGYIDGDGCWYLNKKYHTRQFCVSSKYDQNWSFLSELLDTLKCNYKITRSINKKNQKHSIVRICDKTSLKILINFVYPDNKLDIGFTRKFSKAKQMLNEISN